MSHLLNRKNVGKNPPINCSHFQISQQQIPGEGAKHTHLSYTVNDGWELKPSTFHVETQASLTPEVL